MNYSPTPISTPLRLGLSASLTAANWVTKAGGLPPYIKRLSKHMPGDESEQIASAVNAARRMCETGDLNWPGMQDVNPGSRAEACAAIAHWEAMKAG